MKNTKEVFKRLDAMPVNSQRSACSPLLVLLPHIWKDTPSWDEWASTAYALYNVRLAQVTMERDAVTQSHEKTQKEMENWCPWKDLVAYAESMPIEKPKQWLYKIVALLYTRQSPARHDYNKMRMVHDAADMTKSDNFLLFKDGSPTHFVFGDYKTASTYHSVKVEIKREMVEYILSFLNGRTEGYLLQNKDGSPLTKGQLGYAIKMAFAKMDGGKHVTVNLLRHICASENVDITKAVALHQLSVEMMHSQKMQLQYSKHLNLNMAEEK